MKGFRCFMRWLHAGKRAALAAGMALLAGCASLQGVPPAPSTLPPLDGARQFRAVTCGEHADGRQSLVVGAFLYAICYRSYPALSSVSMS